MYSKRDADAADTGIENANAAWCRGRTAGACVARGATHVILLRTADADLLTACAACAACSRPKYWCLPAPTQVSPNDMMEGVHDTCAKAVSVCRCAKFTGAMPSRLLVVTSCVRVQLQQGQCENAQVTDDSIQTTAYSMRAPRTSLLSGQSTSYSMLMGFAHHDHVKLSAWTILDRLNNSGAQFLCIHCITQKQVATEADGADLCPQCLLHLEHSSGLSGLEVEHALTTRIMVWRGNQMI